MKYQVPTGMHDLLKEDLAIFEKILKIAQKIADFYGFSRIETPILEQTDIFEKGTGLMTDIVEKEMYSFTSKGGDRLTLRPELTPGLVRAYIEHGMQALPKPVNLWYLGPCFRHERPQAGRYRQFHQLGFECLGAPEPVVDALVILICFNILKALGFKSLSVEVNSIGCSACRPYFKKTLLSHLRKHQTSLCADCKRRLKKNPLRILDCKEEKCERIKKSCPQILDHLCRACHDHFKTLFEFFDELQFPYRLNPFLVRGLDYYTKTVFEIIEDTEAGRQQGSLAGGGRYDDLVKLLGGKDTPACGWAMGLERIANLIKGKAVDKKEETADVFLAQAGELAKRKCLKLLEDFRVANINIAHALSKDSLSAQLKIADKLNAKVCIIIGQQEALNDQVIMREMKTGTQKTIQMSKAAIEVKKKIK